MRITLIIFTLLFSVLAIGGSAVLTWRDFRDGHRLGLAKSDVVQRFDTSEDPQLTARLAEASSLSTKLELGGVAAGLASAFGLASLIAMFARSRKLRWLPLAVAAGAVAMVAINPSYETGYGPADARTLALISGVPMLFLAGAVHALRSSRARTELRMAS